jgi:hypothetical protein
MAPGGVQIYETFAGGSERVGRPHNPDFLLRPGELLEAFAPLTVVAFEQGEVAIPAPAVIQPIAATAGPLDRLPDAAGLDRRLPKEQSSIMSNVAKKLMSLDEFLAWERDRPEKYEHTRGVVKAIGPTRSSRGTQS